MEETSRAPMGSRLQRAVASAVLLAPWLLAPLSGCYHYRVSAPQVANLDEGRSETKWAFFWGLVQEPETDTSCVCKNNGLKEATASTNLAYLLLGVASLGIAVPTELEYVCGKPPPDGRWPDPPRHCPDYVDLPPPPAGHGTPPSAETTPETEPESEPETEPETEPGERHDPDSGFF